MIHEFLIDYLNQGYFYKIVIVGDKQEIETYLQTHSYNVRYLGEREPRPRDKKNGRKLPCGKVIACKASYDRLRIVKEGVRG